jgi:hypothetical protein
MAQPALHNTCFTGKGGSAPLKQIAEKMQAIPDSSQGRQGVPAAGNAISMAKAIGGWQGKHGGSLPYSPLVFEDVKKYTMRSQGGRIHIPGVRYGA